jgi:hypothetical protein
LAVAGQAITFTDGEQVTTWYHHDGARLHALASNWSHAMGFLPGSRILVTQSDPEGDDPGLTFLTVCSGQPLAACDLVPAHRT